MQNILKSVFISLFPVIALYVLGINIIHIYTLGFSLLILGKILTSVMVVIFFAGLFIKPRARTTKSLRYFSIPIGIGFLIVLFTFLTSKVEFKDVLLPLIIALSWVLYLVWYSKLEFNTTQYKLKKGSKLPNLELETIDKNNISTSSFNGKSTIYLFYRGNWCPLCMAQINEVVQQYKELEKLQVNMVLVSPQPHHFSKSLANKHQVPFHFLTDKKNKAAKKLGIIHKSGLPFGFQVFGYSSDTVMPTVIITNKTGEIVFIDQTDNYRVRPEPTLFLDIIKNLK